MQIAAGSRSAGLDELLALRGATHASFAEATSVLERLTLVPASPNTVRDATEQLGAVLVEHPAHRVAHAQTRHALPRPATSLPVRLYVTMDGVLAHLPARGWSELKVGGCYQPHRRPARTRPDHLEVRAQSASYVTALSAAPPVGWHLWCDAARRGARAAEEGVVLGAGAPWLGKVAAEPCPAAPQLLDGSPASA